MLTDAALRNLKPKSRIYKASDRDGMYVTVSPSGTVSFRYDYRFHGRRETLTLGRYGPGGISLAMARELLLEARKAVLNGISPAHEKQREKRRVVAIKTFGTAMEAWLANARLADSTRAMRKHIIDRDILPVFRNRLLTEIQAEDLRALCNKVKERGAPATAVQIRDIVKQVFVYAIAHGEKVDNPANSVGAASIATFVPKDRALSPLEIRLMVQHMESVATYPTIKLALRLILLTLVRKSELIQATWDENMRKLMLAHPGSFPAPVHEGSASIWHLADVLAWLQARGSYSVAKDVVDVAQVALQVNVAKEGRRLPRFASKELEALVG